MFSGTNSHRSHHSHRIQSATVRPTRPFSTKPPVSGGTTKLPRVQTATTAREENPFKIPSDEMIFTFKQKELERKAS